LAGDDVKDVATPTTVAPIESASVASKVRAIDFLRWFRKSQFGFLAPELFDRDIVYCRVFFRDCFLINKPEYIEHVLLTNQGNYPKSHFVQRMVGPIFGQGLLLSNGELWRRQRRIASPAFHNRRIAEFADVMRSSAEAALARWSGLTGPFDVGAELMALTLDIIARTMFSTDVSGKVEEVRQLVEDIVALRPSILDVLDPPEWFPRRRPTGFRKATKAFDDLVSRILTERRASDVDRHDLMSLLLAARDPHTGEGMSDRLLRNEILTIFLTGHETTANALTWTLALLSKHPKVEERLLEELDLVLGGRMPTYADLAKLNWTRMVLEEAIRLYPPVPTLLRTAIGEDRIGGVRIPAGSDVAISMYVTHRNPKLWPEPERFDPERFSTSAIARHHRFAHLPFGSGPRVCIGLTFALAEAQIILAAIVQRYQVRLAPGFEVVPSGLWTLRPKNGLWVTVERRPGKPTPAD
jgi:cytochrome P450